MKENSTEQSSPFSFKKNTSIKIVYSENFVSDSSNVNYTDVKVLYGKFQHVNKNFVHIKYANSDDEAFVNINTIIMITEVKK